MPSGNTCNTLTREEAERAIYLDFEGFQDQPPVLAGVLVEGKFTRLVFDPAFEPAAQTWGLSFGPGRDAMERLLSQCRSENRRLVCYSEHELNVLADCYGLDASDVYCNARVLLKRWKNRFHPDLIISDWSLRSFCAAFEHPISERLQDKHITPNLLYVRTMLEDRKTFRRLTKVAKQKWRLVLELNKVDCTSMRCLVKKAAKAFTARK